MINAVETKGLTKYYGKFRGVCNLNIRIQEGEIYGFIGPNGAGKSTTIRLLLNFLFPTEGEGNIFNLDIVTESAKIKNIVGYVPSEVNYYANMTVKELFEYSSRYYKISLDKSFNKLVEGFDLDLSRKIKDLSLGNKKKTAIVQSLIHKPKLLVLDEPTSGLDPLMKNQFFETIKTINNEGTTIFFSSHILSEVEKICHRVAIIKKGEVMDVNDVASLKNKFFSRVSYKLREKRNADSVLKMPGVIPAEQTDDSCSFIYHGDINELLKHLSQLPIEKVSITEPDLEEIFMHYYKD